MEFSEPAQSQVASNRLGYILLKLISDGAIEGNALLNFAYELVAITAEKGFLSLFKKILWNNTDSVQRTGLPTPRMVPSSSLWTWL